MEKRKSPTWISLGTGRFFPVVSTMFSCDLKTLGASGREAFDPFAATAASHKSSNARAKAVLVLVAELPPSGEEITVEECVAEIDHIEGMALGTGGTGGWGPLACIILGLGRDEWSGCAEGVGLMTLLMRRRMAR